MEFTITDFCRHCIQQIRPTLGQRFRNWIVYLLMPQEVRSLDRRSFYLHSIAIIDSMTLSERESLTLLMNPRRQDRVARGSGRSAREVRELVHSLRRLNRWHEPPETDQTAG